MRVGRRQVPRGAEGPERSDHEESLYNGSQDVHAKALFFYLWASFVGVASIGVDLQLSKLSRSAGVRSARQQVRKSAGRQAGKSAGRQVGRSARQQFGKSAGRPAGWQVGRPLGRQV